MKTTLRTRDQIDQAYLWNLENYYTSDKLWEADYHAVEAQLPALAAYKNHVAESAETLFAALTLRDTVNAVLDRLFVYAFLRRDEDLTDSENQARADRAMALYARFRATISFFNSEILIADDTAFDSWFEVHPSSPVI